MRQYHSSLLASRSAIRQVEVLDQADAAADAVERAVARVWRQLLSVMAENHGQRLNYLRALIVISQLQTLVPEVLAQRFGRAYLTAYKGAARAATSSLPMAFLRQLSPVPAEVVESYLREDLAGSLQVDIGGVRSRQPVRRKRSAAREREVYEDIIFPGPTEAEVSQTLRPFVRPGDWQSIGNGESKRMPTELADMLAKGISRGLTQQQLAKELLPYFAGQQARARTVARTFSMAVAQQARFDANEKLGSLAVGYQIHATRDARTRPEHAARDGTVYYKEPKPGQKGLDQMPKPPLEADGSIAFNCRCWLSPVLKSLDHIAQDPAKLARFETASKSIVPDPIDYSNWFDLASEKQRIQAIGPTRYRTVQNRLSRPPQYADFVDQESGGLLPVDTLRNESGADLAARRREVDALFTKRREQIRQISTYGFELPGTDELPPPTKVPRSVPPQPIVHASARTSVQAESFARERLGIDASYGKGHLKVANMVNALLTKLRNAGEPLAGKVIIDRTMERRAPAVPIAFDMDSGELFVNPVAKHDDGSKVWEDPARVASANAASGFWSTGEPTHFVAHELAHKYHWATIGKTAFFQLGGQKVPEELRGIIALEVGRYAAEDPCEFVAEAYCLMLSGRRLSQILMDYYTRLGGPLP